MELIGALALLAGLAILSLTLDTSGALFAVLKDHRKIMPLNLKIEVLAEEDAKEITRRKRSADEVSEYVQLLKDSGAANLGKVLRLPVETRIGVDIPADPKRKERPEAHKEDIDYIVGAESDEEPDGISVRKMKRRLAAAAVVLGYEMKWREPKGWLIGEIVATKVKTTTEAVPTPEPEVEPEAAPIPAPAKAAPIPAPAKAAPIPAPAKAAPTNGSRKRK